MSLEQCQGESIESKVAADMALERKLADLGARVLEILRKREGEHVVYTAERAERRDRSGALLCWEPVLSAPTMVDGRPTQAALEASDKLRLARLCSLRDSIERAARSLGLLGEEGDA